MHIAVVNLDGTPSVRLVRGNDEPVDTTGVDTATADPGEEGVLEDNPSEDTAEEVEVSKDPGPIVPELKELAWGAGSFIVLAVLMRFVLFPKLKRGMDARYASDPRRPRGRRSATRAAARCRGGRVRGAARRRAAPRRRAASRRPGTTLEGERQAALAELNARLAEQRRRRRRRSMRHGGGRATRSRLPSSTSPVGPASWPPVGAPTSRVVQPGRRAR